MNKELRNERAGIVVADFAGIIPYNEAFYLESLKLAARNCIQTFELYKNSLESNPDPEIIAALIQESLSHAAALSRFFWSGRNDKLATARGEKLRSAFNIPDNSPLKNRALRNAMEHFDEKLDEYLLQNVTGYIFPQVLIGDHTLADDNIAHIFKLIDVHNSVCVILGVKYHFGEIFSEVEKVLYLSNTSRNGRLPSTQSSQATADQPQ